MRHSRRVGIALTLAGAAGLAACSADERALGLAGARSGGPAYSSTGSASGRFTFTPLPASAVCTPGGVAEQPFILPDGFEQVIIASEPDYDDVGDMLPPTRSAPRATAGPRMSRSRT
jgi:hypothetical protein